MPLKDNAGTSYNVTLQKSHIISPLPLREGTLILLLNFALKLYREVGNTGDLIPVVEGPLPESYPLFRVDQYHGGRAGSVIAPRYENRREVAFPLYADSGIGKMGIGKQGMIGKKGKNILRRN